MKKIGMLVILQLVVVSFLSMSAFGGELTKPKDCLSQSNNSLFVHEFPQRVMIPEAYSSLQFTDTQLVEFFQRSVFYDKILPLVLWMFMMFGVIMFVLMVCALLEDLFKKIFKKEKTEEEVEEIIDYKKIVSASRYRRRSSLRSLRVRT